MDKYHIKYPLKMGLYYRGINKSFDFVINQVNKIERSFVLYRHRTNTYEIFNNTRNYVDMNFTAGEGWLLPSEIITYAKKGVKSFIVVQPFGCMPNHVSGRGLFRKIKKLYPVWSI